MTSEMARECLEKCVTSINSYGDRCIMYSDALALIGMVEAEAEEQLQTLREEYADDIKRLVDKWENSDKKIDRLFLKETEAYKADIEKYKREIEELKQRLAIAERVIAEKNKQPRK